MAVGIRIVGLRRLQQTMRASGVDMKDLKDLNRRAASVVAPRVQATTPVGPAARGHLASTVRVTASARAGSVKIGGKTKPYAGITHWGSPHDGHRANPWATRAAASTEHLWTAIYQDGIEDILAKIEGA